MASNQGITMVASRYSFAQTVERIEAALQSKGIKLFTMIDHSGEAEKAGLEMPPTKLIIFGNPKGGTPLMLASPSIALDLPLKVLVSEDAEGKVWLSFNDAEYLRARHALPAGMASVLAAAGAIAAAAGA